MNSKAFNILLALVVFIACFNVFTTEAKARTQVKTHSQSKSRTLSTCKDEHHKCRMNTDICHHGTYHLMMVHLCPNACDLCNEHIALKAQCQDKLTSCKVEMCEKANYKVMMKKLCAKSCKYC
ncbi:hypothetical protein M3Y94_01086300 [Aphelenchoides besseyi]|nr:hypothetical protein M3Y94_01086300 [Aphelenchoides besseyi]KAI6221755.1 hypothetical protein M3Y95_00995600 [Aphelenchoides besseyi]